MADQAIVLSGGDNAKPAVQWDPNSGAALPAYLTQAQEELGTNIPDRNTVPSLSYEGKVWQIIKDGNRTKLQSANADGDVVPIPVMRLVILNFNADRGRAYYEGTYDPTKVAAPKCWSADGKAPDPSVREKQSALCNGCPMSIKGSKIDGGRELVACSSHRMIAIAPGFEINGDPLRLKIAVTSDYDKEVVEHGWFAFRQYVDFLKSRGITNTALVITKVKFDNNQAYPKLLFALDRPITPEEFAQVKVALANPKLPDLLTEKWTAAGSNGTPSDEADIKPHGLEGAYADGWTAHPDAAGYSYKGQEVVDNATLAARYPAPVAAAPAVPSVPAASAGNAPTAPVETPAPVSASAAPKEMAPTGPTKPSDPAHIHLPGTPDEMWWIDNAWVKVSDLQAQNTAAPVVEAGPPPAPVVVAPAAPSGLEAALADGWAVHPNAPGYHYRGQEVVADADLAARYPAVGNGASAATSAAPAAPAAPSDGTTATSSASPSDADIPADVKELLGKWAG